MSYKENILRHKGTPSPLGVSRTQEGTNFALFSKHAQSVTLCLFLRDAPTPFAQFSLDPSQNKTGWVWHLCLELPSSTEIEYAYQVDGEKRLGFTSQYLLSDPYALGLSLPSAWGKAEVHSGSLRGRILLDKPFDWEGDLAPNIPLEDLILYELHVRYWTLHPSSQVRYPGTFLGLIEKIPHLKELGVNAVELMPVFEFNENELHRLHPKTHQPLKNGWGYSPLNFFSPMNRYASSSQWTSAIDDFRTLVRALHKHGIEVYLDVVYNHTAEGGRRGPHFSFRGIDNSVYYLLGPKGEYLNFSGTGNTLNANHPVVAELLLCSLKYWVKEMHVDGFRFDLASCLTRDKQGMPTSTPLLIEHISHDPELANIKLIAEPWDAAGLYQVGHFPGNGRWLEWNGVYRDSVRRFIKGSDHEAGAFAKALCGSQDLFGHNKTPNHSINFITCHDGFTLHDLISYNHKHNAENGEHNRDGCSHNDSWNCGHEGETTDAAILALRKRQMRNFHTALMLSLGTPMLFMGDEYGHTKKGNNNTYCQDNDLNAFLWSQLENDPGWLRFYTLLIQWRKTQPLLRRHHFLSEKEIHWHGTQPLHPDWSPTSRLVAYSLLDDQERELLYIAFNADHKATLLHLPPLPPHRKWYRKIDTSLPSPLDFIEDSLAQPSLDLICPLPSHSALVAAAL